MRLTDMADGCKFEAMIPQLAHSLL
jgi:hypothetical protein